MLNRKKQILFQKQSEVVKAIAHPLRIAIVDLLKDGERCVCDIAEYVGSERSNVSRHLSVMVSASVLAHYKKGLKVIYKIKTPCIIDFLSCLTNCLKERARENEELLKAL